ncbi:phosphate ABC transporter permease subunit PstC [Salinispira pacifica]|uniref:Phosphate transport system permease protein n=1 Tax=Salinispira pacifica TaxID=1307761 RepID=V5WFD6_9SPIO|nr:phosphate ABC transporter permease subunit PstC [Salinispira pacifica]AHC13896.1 Phosphate transport system permease protein PstC [Salinispira pacifica]
MSEHTSLETSPGNSAGGDPASPEISFAKRSRPHESIIQGVLFAMAIMSILTTAGIVIILTTDSMLFWREVSVWEFFTSKTWQPMLGRIGVLPLLNSTIMTSTIAMLVATPLGLFVAIYLSEYAPPNVKSVLKPILEILAGVPTVVYGYFALTFMTPLLKSIFGAEVVNIYNTASAGIVMGILILPLIASMTEDALSAVPDSLRQAAHGLGATKMETSIQIVVPAAISGIAAAFIVGISRAIGETMIVALAAGAGPNFTFNPFEAAETLTGYIVRISGGDVSYNTIDYNSIFALGLLLFVFTLILNIISRQIVKRYREVYE